MRSSTLSPERGWLATTDDGVRLCLRVTPRARRAAIGGLAPGRDGAPRLRVSVTAAPEDGAANEAVMVALARAAHLPKSAIRLISGATDRDKLVAVEGAPSALEALFRPLGETAP